jgi:peptidyl-prolyl cis-trans isomerase SurA
MFVPLKANHPISMKLLLSIVASLTLIASAKGQIVHNIWEYPITQGIAAQVEDRIITFEEVRSEMAALIPRVQQESKSKEEFEKKMGNLYVETIQSMVDRYLIVKEFKEKKYNFPDSIVQNEYDRMLIEDFNNDRTLFHKHLDSIGMNQREFRQDLRERFLVMAMRQNQKKSLSEISPVRIEQYYGENKNEFFQEESIHLRLIMLRPIADESPDLMRQQIETIQKELTSGKSFEEVAKNYSQDTRRSRGGDWGWVTRKDLNATLADPAFALKTGHYSDPVTIGKQTFILYVEERRSEGIQPLIDVRASIEDKLASEQSRLVQQTWVERLRQKAYIKYY